MVGNRASDRTEYAGAGTCTLFARRAVLDGCSRFATQDAQRTADLSPLAAYELAIGFIQCPASFGERHDLLPATADPGIGAEIAARTARLCGNAKPIEQRLPALLDRVGRSDALRFAGHGLEQSIAVTIRKRVAFRFERREHGLHGTDLFVEQTGQFTVRDSFA